MKHLRLLVLVVLSGCAATCQDFRMGCRNEMATDWLVVQYANDGSPTACWQVRDNALGGHETATKWIDPASDNIVFINVPHNIVQVGRGDFAAAARTLGVDASKCTGGRYEP